MGKAIKNITAERIVIGILLNHPEWIVELKGDLKAEYFFLLGHKTIYYIVDKLLNDGVENIDSMAILARAERIPNASKVVEDNGGLEYLEELKYLAKDYTKDDFELYAREVITTSYKNSLIDTVDDIRDKVHENLSWTIEDSQNFTNEKLQYLDNKYTSGVEFGLIGDVIDETIAEIEEMRTKDGILGLPSKINKVNEYFSYQKGELIVIGGRAKYGKSNWAINEAHHLAVENNIPVAYFDTEMQTRIFLSRLLSVDSQVPLSDILSGKYKDNKESTMRVKNSMERIRKAPIIHDYRYDWDRSKIRSSSKLLKIRYGIEMLIYDYIKVKEVGQGAKEHSELGNMTIFLKDLAGELDIPILSFAQLSPYEIRLADSDKINRYASVVAYLLPKSKEEIVRDYGANNGGKDYIYIDYNRLGKPMDDPSVGINLFYNRPTVTFEQASYQAIDDMDM